MESIIIAILLTIVIWFVLRALKAGTQESKLANAVGNNVLTSVTASNVEKTDDTMSKLQERAGKKPVQEYLTELGSFQTSLHNFGGGAK